MIFVNGEKIEQNHFSAGELKIQLRAYDATQRINILWRYENDAEYFTLACIRGKYQMNSCYLTLPYLPHARMDRVKNPEDVFTLKMFCNHINALCFNEVTIWDAHSNVGVALLDRVTNLSPKLFIDDVLMNFSKENLALFFPDEGAQKRYGEMFPELPQAFGIKKRNWETQKIEGLDIVDAENIKGKRVVIIDDICSYGNTFVRAAQALHDAGAEEINLYITHCEDAISKGNVFTCGLINRVFTTSSLVRSAETEEKLFHV